MNVTNIRQVNINQQKPQSGSHTPAHQPSFKGWETPILNFLDTSPAWGACAVDLGFMVAPRTITDFGRGSDAGFETMRREGMGTTNHSSVGLYGTLAGLLLATVINSSYGFTKNDVKAHSIFADSETLEMHTKFYNNALKNPEVKNPLREYLTKTLQHYEAQTAQGNWIKFGEEEINNSVDMLEKEITSTGNKINKDIKNTIRTKLFSSVGVGNNIRIIAEEGKKPHTSRYTIDYVIENAYKLGKAFSKDKVKEAFLNSTSVAENSFLKAMKTMNKNRSLIGVGIASVVGVSTQPLNMYLTKKKTGKSGFVGGGGENKTTAFKIRKAIAATLFGIGALATIGNPKNLVKDLQYKGFTPTIKQFKFIYGVTIMSRFLAARNDNELKESMLKDTLGFANWLILGNFVQKLVAQKLDSSLLKNKGKGIVHWIKNTSLKTREEVLHAALGKKVFKDGKPLSLLKMVKELPKGSAAKKQLTILTIAQLAGYIYSGVVLGFGIPSLNIYLSKRRLAKQAEKENLAMQNTTNIQEDMLKPENRAFLNQKNFTGNRFINLQNS
jgi:hypothetical protein